MQLIDIDKIIGELEKTKEWENYKVLMFKRVWNKNNDIIKKYLTGGIESVYNYKPTKGNNQDAKNDFMRNYGDYEDKFQLLTGKQGILKTVDYPLNVEETDFTWTHFGELKKIFIDKIFQEIYYCSFCGRTPFMENGGLKNFDLDHFFPKNLEVLGKNPFKYLTYNFYNLVPICTFCNQKLKKIKNPLDFMQNNQTIFYPYFGWMSIENSLLKIDQTNNKVDGFSKNYSFYNQNFTDNHSKFYALENFYLKKRDIRNDVLFIHKSKAKILATKQLKINNGANNDELKDYFFKNYAPQSEKDILKFSNGKFKKDLIDNLKIGE